MIHFSLLTRASLFVFFTFILIPIQALAETYTFSIVPQQASSKTVKSWGPLLKYLQQKTGHNFKIKLDSSIPKFEKSLQNQAYDFAYMNPYHYVLYHESAGYQALAKAKDKQLFGILVTQKDSAIKSLKDLAGKELMFPSPKAFAASMLPRAELKQEGISFSKQYVKSHDSVYLNVSGGHGAAGGGVMRTLKTQPDKIKDKLTVLWKSKGFTPHAIAANKRVPADVVSSVQQALEQMDSDAAGKKILATLKLKGFSKASDADWNDVRALQLQNLD